MSPRSGAQTQIRDRFLQDNRRIEELLAQVLQALDRPERATTLWKRFESELRLRMDTEERHLIPALIAENERAARAILQEHKHLQARLTELGAGLNGHVDQVAAARAFADELRAHTAHENRVLYSWADRHFDEDERDSVFAALSDHDSEEPHSSGRLASNEGFGKSSRFNRPAGS